MHRHDDQLSPLWFFFTASDVIENASSQPFAISPQTLMSIVKGLYSLKPGKYSMSIVRTSTCFVLKGIIIIYTVFFCLFKMLFDIVYLIIFSIYTLESVEIFKRNPIDLLFLCSGVHKEP